MTLDFSRKLSLSSHLGNESLLHSPQVTGSNPVAAILSPCKHMTYEGVFISCFTGRVLCSLGWIAVHNHIALEAVCRTPVLSTCASG